MSFKSLACIFILILTCQSNTFTSDNDLTLARIYFQKAGTIETAANNLKLLAEPKINQPVFKAYYGAAMAILAKYAWNPYKKLERLRNGLSFLNAAVSLDKMDIEIRFLRFAIEEHVPAHVKFDNHIQDDSKFLLEHLSPSHPCYLNIKSYLKLSKSIPEEDRKKL